MALNGKIKPLHVFFLALLLRLVFISFLPPTFLGSWDDDSGSHVLLARNLVHHHAFELDLGTPSARYPPAYPWFLMFPMALDLPTPVFFVLVRVLQAILLSVVCVYVFKMADSAFGPGTGWIAGVLCAIYPPLIAYPGTLMADAFYTFLLASGLYGLFSIQKNPTPGKAAAVGALWGFTALCREPALLLAPLCALLLPWLVDRNKWKVTVFFLAAWALTLTPWLVRNRVLLGQWAPVTLRGPQFLYISQHIPEGGYWEMDGAKLTAEYNRLSKDFQTPWAKMALQESAHNIVHRPGAYFQMLGDKFSELWLHPSGLQQLARWRPLQVLYLSGHVLILGFMAWGMIMMLRSDPRPTLFPMIALAFVTFLHLFLVFPLARYFVPMLPWVMMFAAGGLSNLWKRT